MSGQKRQRDDATSSLPRISIDDVNAFFNNIEASLPEERVLVYVDMNNFKMYELTSETDDETSLYGVCTKAYLLDEESREGHLLVFGRWKEQRDYDIEKNLVFIRACAMGTMYAAGHHRVPKYDTNSRDRASRIDVMCHELTAFVAK